MKATLHARRKCGKFIALVLIHLHGISLNLNCIVQDFYSEFMGYMQDTFVWLDTEKNLLGPPLGSTHMIACIPFIYFLFICVHR